MGFLFEVLILFGVLNKCISLNVTSNTDFVYKGVVDNLMMKFQKEMQNMTLNFQKVILNMTENFAKLSQAFSILRTENQILQNTTKMQEDKILHQQQIVSLIQTDLKVTGSSTVKDDLIGLHADVIANNQALSTMRDDLLYLHKEKEELKNKTFSIEKRISVLSTTVGFSAYNSNDMSVRENQAIVFDIVVSEVGTGYSKQTGIFTAPVSGTYEIYASLRGNTQFTRCFVKIFKNGSSLTGLYYSNNRHMEGDSTLAFVQMIKGDRIWLANIRSDACTVDDTSTFTVILLKATT